MLGHPSKYNSGSCVFLLQVLCAGYSDRTIVKTSTEHFEEIPPPKKKEEKLKITEKRQLKEKSGPSPKIFEELRFSVV